MKFGYNKSEIRSKSVSSTSPSGYEVLSSTGMTCAPCTMRLPVVPEATTPPKLTPKDVSCVDKEKLGMEHDLIETMKLENLTGQASQGLYSGGARHESRGRLTLTKIPLSATMCSG